MDTAAATAVAIPLAANGINRASPAQLAMGFWYGGNSSITIDHLAFTN